MEVKFADTFFDSFKKMVTRERWHWKLWDGIRYDIPRFFKNLWHFRKALWNFNWWNATPALDMFKTSLVMMEKNTRTRGHEIDSSRLKKADKMARAVVLMQHFIDDDFIEQAEIELGEIVYHPWTFEDVPGKEGFSQIVDKSTPEEKEHESKVFKRAREIEEEQWTELWDTIKGQDFSKFKEYKGDDPDKSHDHWVNQFDGSGIRGWWD